MKYQIAISGYSAECVAGVIPDKIWKYIQDECNGDVDSYVEKLDDGEVPDEFKIAEDSSSFCDADFACGSKVFWHESGLYEGTLTVYEEDSHKEIMSAEAKDLPSDFKAWSTSATAAAEGKPYFVWKAEEDGDWLLEFPIETDKPFDKSKLKLLFGDLAYGNGTSHAVCLGSIEYDGEQYEIALDSSSTKGHSVEFFKDR